ncbi:dihydrodipicolinate synthase family protein [Gordonia sp. TBRC 11910]|uniref:Dihydrodipicolinate synthase family protein n=1 Tax=Gordonia asplenii TaxID=2725283 RepID=A0A848KZL9_9ACTN|nr:dihydrodipicolinate synthase family protein [Gordonia asplenii]NMO03662.1 dihydrodipicolinate synthase family protein [Gordonia asplenii]
MPESHSTGLDPRDVALQHGCYAMGITPFTRGGTLDESALRAQIRWLASEQVGFWPASPATGEGVLMTDAEIFRTWEIAAEEIDGRLPVVAANREFPTADRNIAFAREAKALGLNAIQLYPPTLGHSFVPTVAMHDRFYDEVLSSVDIPVVLSCNSSTGFDVPSDVIDRLVSTYPHVIGVFKHHPDQSNVADFVARIASRTTVLTMAPKLMFAHADGARGELDNLQNIAPRTCRRLYDALEAHDIVGVNESYRRIVTLASAIAHIGSDRALPRVVVYKAISRILGGPGGYPRAPYGDVTVADVSALRRMLDDVGLVDAEGLAAQVI